MKSRSGYVASALLITTYYVVFPLLTLTEKCIVDAWNVHHTHAKDKQTITSTTK
jgi:hypothetical protein